MDWKKLYQMQAQLDQYIIDNHNLSADEDLFSKRYLALLVELGELANETRCFKFWSTKPSSEREVVLDEYVDGIHFLLSLGLEKKYYFSEVDIKGVICTETEQFNNVFAAATAFNQDRTKENYDQLFITFLQLGQLLGFQAEDIQAAYNQKNEVNFKRQDQGY